jgi:hypothetical protein
LIKDLSNPLKKLPNGESIKVAHGILIAKELKAFLVEDPKALITLTDLYDTHDNEGGWSKNLKEESYDLKDPCLVMLSATNERNFHEFVTPADVESGFIGRTLLVRETRPKRRNALTHAPKVELNLDRLAKRLVEISQIKGEFKWTSAGMRLFEKWYDSLGLVEQNDITGTESRIDSNVLKTAIIFSLARKDELKLEIEDIELAIEKCNECCEDLTKLIPSVELSNGNKPNVRGLIMKYLEDGEYEMSKAAMISKLRLHQVLTAQLDFHIADLVKTGFITVKIDKFGSGHINQRTMFIATEEFFNNRRKKKARA